MVPAFSLYLKLANEVEFLISRVYQMFEDPAVCLC